MDFTAKLLPKRRLGSKVERRRRICPCEFSKHTGRRSVDLFHSTAIGDRSILSHGRASFNNVLFYLLQDITTHWRGQ